MDGPVHYTGMFPTSTLLAAQAQAQDAYQFAQNQAQQQQKAQLDYSLGIQSLFNQRAMQQEGSQYAQDLARLNNQSQFEQLMQSLGTQKDIAGLNADTSRYSADIGLQGQQLGAKSALEQALLSTGAQRDIAGINAASQRYGIDAQSAASRLPIEAQQQRFGAILPILQGIAGSLGVSGMDGVQSAGQQFSAPPAPQMTPGPSSGGTMTPTPTQGFDPMVDLRAQLQNAQVENQNLRDRNTGMDYRAMAAEMFPGVSSGNAALIANRMRSLNGAPPTPVGEESGFRRDYGSSMTAGTFSGVPSGGGSTNLYNAMMTPPAAPAGGPASMAIPMTQQGVQQNGINPALAPQTTAQPIPLSSEGAAQNGINPALAPTTPSTSTNSMASPFPVAGPLISQQQQRQMLNNSLASNQRDAAGQMRQAQNTFGARGFAPTSPALRSFGNRVDFNRMNADTTARTQIPLQVSQANADYGLKQQAQGIDAYRAKTGAISPLLSAFAGLV